ncbi:MAG: hypothetical protein ABSB41_08490 [Anaerolineales bacterium]|jgi:hypothetical protein
MPALVPRGITREEASTNIGPGKILYLFTALPPRLIPSDKYFVVVGFDEYPLLLKVNSKEKLIPNHLVLKKSIYSSFLKYDSFLDCDRVWYILSYEEIVGQLISDPQKRIIGEILKDHARIIVSKVNSSRSIALRHKEIITNAFKAAN